MVEICVTGLNQKQLSAFEHDGFLVIDDVFDQYQVLDPVRREYAELLSQLCEQWVAGRRLDPTVLTEPFEKQLLAVYAAGLDYCQPLDISLPPGSIASDTPFHAGSAIFQLMRTPALLDCVESLIGAELSSNPIQHVRIKPPQNLVSVAEVRSFITSTDWHQDRATTLEEADNTQMVTAWVAMTDATLENGCLQVIPGSHRGDMKQHCPLPQLGIPDSLINNQRAQPLPVKSGGVILFHPLTIHGSLNNESDSIRWSFDLRYNVTGQASGRPMFPSFVARSASAPATEMHDADHWRQLWLEARASLANESDVAIHRWVGDADICA